MKAKNLNIFCIIVLLVIIAGCAGKNQETKNTDKSIEQIREEKGVPVKIIKIEKRQFEHYLSLYSTLSGIQQSTKNSGTADKIQKIFFKVGDNVKEGQVVMQFPTNTPNLQYSQAKTALDNAEKLYNRMKELLKTGETSQMNFDNAETQYLVAKRNWEAINQIIFVQAPISGKIIEIYVKEGDNVDYGKPLFTVAQIHKMKAMLWVSEKEVNLLKVGMPAEINVNEETFVGKITEISLAMDSHRRAFRVQVEFDNKNQKLKSGITVEVKIKIYSNPEAIVVPRHLVQTEGNKKFVYVENNGIAERRFIETGVENNTEIEVISGLKIGDNLIVEGTSLLKDGIKVKID